MNTIFTFLSRHIILIISILFLLFACYMVYIKYYSTHLMREGMGEGRLKDIIHKIAIDKNPNVTNANKLTAIKNVLLVSSDKIPTKTDIEAKKGMLEISGLSQKVQNEKIQDLSGVINNIHPQFKKIYPQLDTSVLNTMITTMVKQSTTPNTTNTTPTGTKTNPVVKYTFNEQLFMVINNTKLDDIEKIKIIVKLTKPKINIGKTLGSVKKYSKKLLSIGKKKKKTQIKKQESSSIKNIQPVSKRGKKSRKG